MMSLFGRRGKRKDGTDSKLVGVQVMSLPWCVHSTWHTLVVQKLEAWTYAAVSQVSLPPTHELHDPCGEFRYSWADYSANDAKATWQLRESLYR
jgi:hypothetical protein